MPARHEDDQPDKDQDRTQIMAARRAGRLVLMDLDPDPVLAIRSAKVKVAAKVSEISRAKKPTTEDRTFVNDAARWGALTVKELLSDGMPNSDEFRSSAAGFKEAAYGVLYGNKPLKDPSQNVLQGFGEDRESTVSALYLVNRQLSREVRINPYRTHVEDCVLHGMDMIEAIITANPEAANNEAALQNMGRALESYPAASPPAAG